MHDKRSVNEREKTQYHVTAPLGVAGDVAKHTASAVCGWSRYEGSTVDALALEPMKDAITCEKP